MCLLIALLVYSTAGAAQVQQIDVSRDSDNSAAYEVTAQVELGVPAPLAFREATDFERLPSYNPSIESTRRIDAGSDDQRLDSTMRLCVLWYCKRIRQVMRYQLTGDRAIDMQVVPGAGDLRAGEAHWRFVDTASDEKDHANSNDTGAHTRMQFSARIVPAFWIPPVIGPVLIRRELKQQVQTTADAIEALADHYPDGTSRDAPTRKEPTQATP